MALILEMAQQMGVYCELIRGVDIDGAVAQAIAINKQVTLKSSIRPFSLVKNSALFLIYYGYCVAYFGEHCPDKHQDPII